jgi:acyl carrier protein
MTRQEILRGIEEVACEYLDRSFELRPEMSLREDLELDSLQWVTLAIEVENRFRIYLEDEDELAIESVADLVETVHRKLQAETAPQG